MFKYITALLIISMFGTGSLFSQELTTDPNLIKKTLDNGFTYYIYPSKKVKDEAHFQLFLKVGSLQETNEQRGLAHFLEHMAFNGIENFEKNELISFLESKGAKFGADLNAHTSFHETIYKLQIPTKNQTVVDTTIAILSAWADGILLEGKEIEKERGVVLAEWLSKQSPQRDSQEVFLNAILNKSHYADRTVIGDTAVLKSFSHQELRNFYEKWYDPSLMAVAVAGDVDVEAIEDLIVKEFSTKSSNFPTMKDYKINDYSKDHVEIYTDEWIKKTELNLIQLIPAFANIQTEEDYLEYLSRNLINRLIKERFGKLSFNNPHYLEANISIGNFLPVKGVHISSVGLDKKNIQAGLENFFEETQQIYRYGFTSDEIEKIKTSYYHSFEELISKKEDPSSNVMIAEMHKDFFYNNEIISKEEEFRLLKKHLPKVDSIAIAKSLDKYNQSSATYFLLTANEEEIEVLPTRKKILETAEKFRTADVPRYRNEIKVPEKLLKVQPKKGAIVSQKDIPEINATELELSNGLKVIYKQSELDKDQIILSGFRKGGFYSLDSTQYINGTYATPIISLSGYGEFSREALSQFLAGSSAKATLLADKTRTGFHASSNLNDKEVLFQLLYLKWTEPRVDKNLYDLVKKRSIRNLEDDDPSAAELFGRELKYLLVGENYITRKMDPIEVEEQLSMDALIDVYNHFFGSADGFTVSVVSDQPLESLKPLILQYLGGLPSGYKDLDYRYTNQYSPVKENTDFIQNAGDSPRTNVSLVFQQKDSIGNSQEVDLKNTIVKNVLKTILLEKLREDLGAVYGVNVSASSTLHPIPLSRQTISFVCEPERAEELIEETMKIVRELASHERDFSYELEKTKTNLIKTHELLIQRNTFWTSAIRDHYFDRLESWDFVTDYEEKVKEVSSNDISRSIQFYFIDTPMIRAILYPSK